MLPNVFRGRRKSNAITTPFLFLCRRIDKESGHLLPPLSSSSMHHRGTLYVLPPFLFFFPSDRECSSPGWMPRVGDWVGHRASQTPFFLPPLWTASSGGAGTNTSPYRTLPPFPPFSQIFTGRDRPADDGMRLESAPDEPLLFSLAPLSLAQG